jgi:hypothetical protein
LDESLPVVLEAAEAIRRLPGNQSLVIVRDRTTGEGFAVSTWDTEEHASYDRDVALSGFPARLQAVGVQLDPTQVLEVIA